MSEQTPAQRQRAVRLGWLLVGAALALQVVTMLGLLGNAPTPPPVQPGTAAIDLAQVVP